LKLITKILLLFFLLCVGSAWAQIPPDITRICRSGNDNSLYWKNSTDTCDQFVQIEIWAREGPSFPFSKIATINSIFTNQYLHVDANVPFNKTWEYYLILKRICAGVGQNIISNTVAVDITPPSITTLDSVSVDPETNKVIIGWSGNRSSDFQSYSLYNLFNSGRPDPRIAENYKDTGFIDTALINPSQESLSYDITSVDSCGNRNAFGANIHKTIFLKGTIDTCKNTCDIIWTHYEGWTAIRAYYIYRRINKNNYILLDSVIGALSAYTNLYQTSSGDIIDYFVRAYATGNVFKSSSSNLISFQSAKSVSPKNTYIHNVTVNAQNDLEITIYKEPVVYYGPSKIYKSDASAPFSFFSNLNWATQMVITLIDKTSSNSIHNYIVYSENICSVVSDTSNISRNIVLDLNPAENQNILIWNRYFTWNTGVKEYLIYRGSKVNGLELVPFTILQNNFSDTNFSDNDFSEFSSKLIPACYYIEANQNGGSPFGTSAVSKSNIVCRDVISDFWFPNAISVYGENRIFNFVGANLDYDNSSLRVYNRWGNLIYEKIGIKDGWAGTDMTGNIQDNGVYFFIAEVKKLNGDLIKKTGNITILK